MSKRARSIASLRISGQLAADSMKGDKLESLGSSDDVLLLGEVGAVFGLWLETLE